MIVAWDDAAANAPDTAFWELSADVTDEMVILADQSFHSREGDPPNQQAYKRGTWNVRIVVETIVSLLTGVCRLKKASQRTSARLRTRLAYTMALFNILVLWDGGPADAHRNIHLSIAEFSL